MIVQRWNLVKPGSDGHLEVTSVREYEKSNARILAAANAKLHALLRGTDDVPYPLSKTRPRLLSSMSLECLH